MHLCTICQHCTVIEGKKRCKVNASQSVLLESGSAVSTCPSFRRQGDGKHLLVDRGGLLKPRRS